MFHDLRLPLLDGRVRPRAGLAVVRQFCAAVGLCAAGHAAVAESGAYVPYSGIIRGTEGAAAVPLTLRNASGADIVLPGGARALVLRRSGQHRGGPDP